MMDEGNDDRAAAADPEADLGTAAGEGAASGAEAPEDRLAAVVEERDRLRDQLLRTAADYENFRKRTKRDLEEAERRGREEALKEVLPVIDNLERAVEASDSAKDIKAVADGVRMVLKMFEDVAGRIGLERVTAMGKRFDPNVHDAMQQRETTEHPPGTIVQELVPGYRLGDRLLRPALVVVARPPQQASSSGEGDGASDDGA